MKRNYGNNCAGDSVARLLGIHTSDVPLFRRHGTKGWEDAMSRFLRRRGYKLTRSPYNRKLKLDPHKFYLMYGYHKLCPRMAHMALYRGHKLYYDPSGEVTSPFGRKMPTHVYIPEKVKCE